MNKEEYQVLICNYCFISSFIAMYDTAAEVYDYIIWINMYRIIINTYIEMLQRGIDKYSLNSIVTAIKSLCNRDEIVQLILVDRSSKCICKDNGSMNSENKKMMIINPCHTNKMKIPSSTVARKCYVDRIAYHIFTVATCIVDAFNNKREGCSLDESSECSLDSIISYVNTRLISNIHSIGSISGVKGFIRYTYANNCNRYLLFYYTKSICDMIVDSNNKYAIIVAQKSLSTNVTAERVNEILSQVASSNIHRLPRKDEFDGLYILNDVDVFDVSKFNKLSISHTICSLVMSEAIKYFWLFTSRVNGKSNDTDEYDSKDYAINYMSFCYNVIDIMYSCIEPEDVELFIQYVASTVSSLFYRFSKLTDKFVNILLIKENEYKEPRLYSISKLFQYTLKKLRDALYKLNVTISKLDNTQHLKQDRYYYHKIIVSMLYLTHVSNVYTTIITNTDDSQSIELVISTNADNDEVPPTCNCGKNYLCKGVHVYRVDRVG